MKRIILIFLILITFFSCSQDDLINPTVFTKEFADKLQKAAPNEKVAIISDLELKITGSDGKERTAFLNNCYNEYRLDSINKETIIQKYIASFVEMNPYKDQIEKSRITPVIKDKAWLVEVSESMKAHGSKEPFEMVWEELNEDLVIVYAEDSPKNLRYLSSKDITEAGLHQKELKDLAIRNLRGLLPKVESEGGDGVFMLTAGGDYEASLILFDEIWKEKRYPVKGDYIIAIPSRDVLLVTGSEDKVGIKKVRDLAKKISAEASYRLISRLFIYKSGKFSRFN